MLTNRKISFEEFQPQRYGQYRALRSIER